jgi:hypothetical protein
MARPVLVLPSPFLPATAYSGLAAALEAHGLSVRIAASELAAGEDAHDLVRRWMPLVGDETVVVAHSNSGFLAPAVRARAGGSQATVFVDAALPPVSGTTRLAPPGLRTVLAGLVDDHGVLPPWTRWWPRAVVEDIVPTGGFDELDATCPRLSLDYVDTVITAPPGWAEAPNAYLAFGATYAEELDRARRLGWPHTVLDGAHLHLLVDPVAVAAGVVALVTRLGGSV